jgi:hypothetical protein
MCQCVFLITFAGGNRFTLTVINREKCENHLQSRCCVQSLSFFSICVEWELKMRITEIEPLVVWSGRRYPSDCEPEDLPDSYYFNFVLVG